MNELCQLAVTGATTRSLQILAAVLLAISIWLLIRFRSRGLRVVIATVFVLAQGLTIAAVPDRAQAADCSPAQSSGQTGGNVLAARVWTPSGRFSSTVFSSGDIETEVIDVGSFTNFSGDPETARITLNRPKASEDPELNRPLILALSGGDTAGFCDSSFNTEQAAMLELARVGYVTATLHPVLDPAFCDGEPEQSYIDNMGIYDEVTDIALGYLRDNASTYGVNYARTALYGYSIGGQTALLRLRSDYNSGPDVRVIAAFAAITPFSQDGTLSSHLTATSNSSDIYMMSFEPDNGYGVGVNPDARADCEDLVGIGYECEFFGLPAPGHAVHANSNFVGYFDVRTEFWPYLKQKLVSE